MNLTNKKWLWIGLGGLTAWYFLFKNAKPETTGQVTATDTQTGETTGSGWDILGLLGSVSMD